MFFLILSGFSAVLLVSFEKLMSGELSSWSVCTVFCSANINTHHKAVWHCSNQQAELFFTSKGLRQVNQQQIETISAIHAIFFHKNHPVTTFPLTSPHNQHNPCNHSVCCLEGKSMFVSSIIIYHPLKIIYPTISRILLVLFLSIYKSKVCKIRLISRLQQLTE